MVTLQQDVYAALEGALEGVCAVFCAYPPSDVSLPCVSFYEAENRLQAQAGANEHLTELAYVVDVWSESMLTNAGILAAADAALCAIGGRRTFSHDLYEAGAGIHHKTARYRFVADQDKHIYQ